MPFSLLATAEDCLRIVANVSGCCPSKRGSGYALASVRPHRAVRFKLPAGSPGSRKEVRAARDEEVLEGVGAPPAALWAVVTAENREAALPEKPPAAGAPLLQVTPPAAGGHAARGREAPLVPGAVLAATHPVAAAASMKQMEEDHSRLIFECLDKDRDGFVSLLEFATLMSVNTDVAAFVGFHGLCMEAVVRQSSVVAMLRSLCAADQEELSWSAFLHLVSMCKSRNKDKMEAQQAQVQFLPDDKAARLIFDMIDADKNGIITCVELAAACIMRPKVAEFVGYGGRQSADVLFNQMDENGDKNITLDEFLHFVSKIKTWDEGSCGGGESQAKAGSMNPVYYSAGA